MLQKFSRLERKLAQVIAEWLGIGPSIFSHRPASPCAAFRHFLCLVAAAWLTQLAVQADRQRLRLRQYTATSAASNTLELELVDSSARGIGGFSKFGNSAANISTALGGRS